MKIKHNCRLNNATIDQVPYGFVKEMSSTEFAKLKSEISGNCRQIA
jgi:hypothetical protein